jgi:hypothetical protein
LDSSVGITTGYELDGLGSIPGKGQVFSVLHSFQIGSGASHAAGNRGKAVGSEDDHSLPSSAQVKNDEATLLLPHEINGMLLNYLNRGQLYLVFYFTECMTE